MRLCFVRPLAQANRFIQNVPLNYVHLAAYLRSKGHEPTIFDRVFDHVTPTAIDGFIRDHRVPVVGIGCMSFEFPQAVVEARRLKTEHPNLKIVFGGAHPSGDPEECLRTGVVDYAIVGEGEIALDRLLRDIETGREDHDIPGVWYVRNGNVVPTLPAQVPDVETLPAPAYDLLDLEEYYRLDSPWHFPKSNRAVQFLSSRGCPYRCSYCHTIHGKRFRGVSAESILDQMETLVRDHGTEEFMVVDDIFNFDLDRAKAICRGIVDRRLGVHLQFPAGLRGDRFDEELMSLMAKAGTHYMAVAIETVSERFQKLIRKYLKLDLAMQTVRWAKKYGIEVAGFFMIGFPGETRQEVEQTLDFALTAPFDTIFISIVAPFKGTVMRNDIRDGRFGHLEAEALANLDGLFPVVENEGLSRDVLRRMQNAAYWRFYLKPRSVVNLAKRMTTRRNVAKVARAVRRRVFEPERVSVN